MKSKRIGITFPDDWLEALASLKAKSGTPVAELVRMFVLEQLEAQGFQNLSRIEHGGVRVASDTKRGQQVLLDDASDTTWGEEPFPLHKPNKTIDAQLTIGTSAERTSVHSPMVAPEVKVSQTAPSNKAQPMGQKAALEYAARKIAEGKLVKRD